MRESLLPLLRCPRCRAEGSFELSATARDEREVREGELTCGGCGHAAPIRRGIVDLLADPPEFVRREAAGLERFADMMRADGWDRERVLRLPDEPQEYWEGQKRVMEHLLDTQDLRPGDRILDVGANTCWASNAFAERGLEVVALDITDIDLQGLGAAELWFEENGVYFERVVSVMFDPALASGSFDHVFCSQVLHHNDPANLRSTFAELHRVLKPGGALYAVNEPLRFPTNLKRDHAEEVGGFEGHEHVYFFHEYLLAARGAGFSVRISEPRTAFFTGEPLWLTGDASLLGSAKVFTQQLFRLSRAGRRAYLAGQMLLGPDVPVGMVCRKPR